MKASHIRGTAGDYHPYFFSTRPNRKLTGHNSCVNALAFSLGDGRWLASAGDGESSFLLQYALRTVAQTDHVVKLWDLHQDNLVAPSCSFSGPAVSP